MKPQNEYIAKEAFTFPLICLVCLAFSIYWGYTDGWPVGAIIGTSFFGVITMCYICKYVRLGRNYLKIDANGIKIKDWSKITVLKWSEIEKCEVYYSPSYAVLLNANYLSLPNLTINVSKTYLSAFPGNTVATGASSRRLSVSAAMMFLTVYPLVAKTGILPD